MHTRRFALALLMEKEAGSPTPGTRFDFAVLDRHIMTMPMAPILGTNVLATHPGGRAVYQKPIP